MGWARSEKDKVKDSKRKHFDANDVVIFLFLPSTFPNVHYFLTSKMQTQNIYKEYIYIRQITENYVSFKTTLSYTAYKLHVNVSTRSL